MSEIWYENKSIRAAFLTREAEREGYRVCSVTDLPAQYDLMQALEHNRTVLSEFFNWPDLQLSMGKQVHETRVSYCSGPGIHDNTDALVTDKPGLALAVLVADCAAVLIADPVHKVVSAIHAGWRGAVGGILPGAVSTMMRFGAEPDVMQAYISSCISRESFEVGEEVANRFPEKFVDRTKEKPHVDLGAFVQQELRKSGIPADSIMMDDRCTVRHPRSLHSYRRDGEVSGRMMAAIALT